MAGYSGTPLVKKLGFDSEAVVFVKGKPDDYAALLVQERELRTRFTASATHVHLFTKQRRELERELLRYREKLADTVVVWVSWPKKSSKVPTDVTEDVIREVALPLGFVDVKVCAVSDVWSGLKLVVRKELRR